ncbi:MAG: hypothetical protein KA807_06085 [Prolixibacteraceae bacterium]|nr:hypothetical protein [Prolixibacteraceae bacterium]
MKNLFKTLIIVIVFLSGINTFAQPVGSTSPVIGSSVPALSAGYVEPVGSIFSYMPLTSTTGQTSDVDEYNWKCWQSFSGVTGSFNTVTIWVMHDAQPTMQRSIRVEVCAAGATPGSVLSSSTSNVNPVNTGEIVSGYAVWEYTITIPNTTLSSGWISVQALTGGSPTFYWLRTDRTPIYPAYQTNGVDTYSYTSWGLSMCLSSGAAVPFSKWAIVAVFVLLIGAVSFRFVRRMF